MSASERRTEGHDRRDLLRFLTCGSVDDGKSTLIGRLLYESQLILDDQLATLAVDSRKHGSTGDAVDFALLVDGLEAERQQGITIDVAYRSFSTARRAFIVADSPGHEQYTRNMATAASTSEAAILLIDGRKGALTQTKRHAVICSLLGIREVAVAINKMDLVDFDENAFHRMVEDFTAFASGLDFTSISAIPVSALEGDNIVSRSSRMPWYRGPTLLEHLERVEVAQHLVDKPFRFSVQRVNRPTPDFRGFSGTVGSGRVAAGDEIVVVPSGKRSRIARIVTADGDLDEARAGDAVTLTLTDEIDVIRGDLVVRPHARPEVTDQLAAHLLWMDEDAMLPGRVYAMRVGNIWTEATVTALRHRVDPSSLDKHAARRLELNEIGFSHLSTRVPIPVEPYEDNRGTGSFILVDRHTNRTAGAGMVAHTLRRASNIHPETFVVDKAARATLTGQRPLIVWFTGLPGSGKSTIANLVERALHGASRHTYTLDGDNLRHGLCRDLGFTEEDRVENIRRAGEVAKLMVDAGLIVLCSFISPFRAERDEIRSRVEEGELVEVFVDTPLEECIRRDPKGLYAKARAGQIPNLTGIGSPYEPPEAPEVHLLASGKTPEELAEEVLAELRKRGVSV